MNHTHRPVVALLVFLLTACSSSSLPIQCGEQEYLDPKVGCLAHTMCPAGQFVASPADGAHDRSCETCPVGLFSADVNATVCMTWTQCPPGTESIGGQSDRADRSCQACAPGGYCAGAEVERQPCAAGTWDDDADAKTTCVAIAEQCQPGQFVATSRNPTTNRPCATCPSGTFSTVAGAAACLPWTDCPAGNIESVSGSTTIDRRCEACMDAPDLPTNAPACIYAKRISSGSLHACALLSDGNVRCWGRGEFGRLGYGKSENIGDNETPASIDNVDLGETVVDIAAGGEHTCALVQGGRVRCWGNGADGRLGYRNTANVGDLGAPAVAGDVDVGGTVIQIVAGGKHTCALLDGGQVRCWGRGDRGQLGYGNPRSIGDDETPASAGEISLGDKAKQISAGAEHTCAVLANGRIRCWGDNSTAQLGAGWVATDPLILNIQYVKLESDRFEHVGDGETPMVLNEIDLGAPATAVAAGRSHTCALRNDGVVFCWGYAPDGRTGNSATHRTTPGTVDCNAVPTKVAYSKPFVSIAVGGSQSCGKVGQDGVVCWGGNMFGEVGYPKKAFIGNLNGTTLEPLGLVDVGGRIGTIATGQSHTCALLSDANIRCWGLGDDGQLGIRGFPKNSQTGDRYYSVGKDEPPSAAAPVPYF